MKIGQASYFSQGCPAVGEYIGPVSTDDLELSVDFCNQGSDGAFEDCVAVAYFGCAGEGTSFYDRRLSEAAAIEVPMDSDEATVLLTAAFKEGAKEQIGRILCDRIGACPGPLKLEGLNGCPALNDDTLGAIIENVAYAEE